MDIEEAKRILGITDEDDGRTAKIKFRRLIGRYHPDAAGTDSKERQELAQKINAAVGKKQNLDVMRRIASLRATENVYPAEQE